MLKEFKSFAMRGNLVDVAVAFVMGAAFGNVISTFTAGIISPLIALIFGSPNLNNLKIVFKPQILNDAGEVVQAEVALLYGTFLTAMMDFIIVAFVMFLLVKGINRLKKQEEAAPAAPSSPSNEEVLLAEIRDLLKR